MKIKPFTISVLLILILCPARSQDKKAKFLHIETGMDFVICDSPNDKQYIRGDVNPDPYYTESSFMQSLMYKSYVGVKAETRLAKDFLGLSSGLRFTRLESSLGRNTYWSSRSDFLYLLFKQDGTTTEYLKIKDITQISNYLGIPVELKIYPYEKKFIQVYYKLGFDLNLLLASNSNMVFYDSSLQYYENEAVGLIEDALPFYATVYAAAGLMLGKIGKPGISIEACGPSVLLYNHGNATLVDPAAGIGFQLNIRFPL